MGKKTAQKGLQKLWNSRIILSIRNLIDKLGIYFDLIMFFLALQYLGAWGVVGYLIIITIVPVMRYFRNMKHWNLLIGNVKGSMETSLFGKPLRKELWDKGEKPKLFQKRIISWGDKIIYDPRKKKDS